MQSPAICQQSRGLPMGTWGYGIRQDDFVCDVIDEFESIVKNGSSVADAIKAVHAQFSTESSDSDDGPLFWIALADIQWMYSEVDSQVLERVKDDFDSGRSLARWDEKQRGLSRRRAVLEKFIRKISTPNSRPKKPPKLVIRSPKFCPGDCLSIFFSDGMYGAALVLAADHSNAEYGKNLIGVLDYLSSKKPSIKVFQERKWLVRTHHHWKNEMDLAWYFPVGFRAAKKCLEVIGQVELLESDPGDSKSYCGWSHIGQQVILQREWDRKASERAN
jgi:hypothetical protein